VRLLIDENISPIIGDALRVAGHDVRAAAVACPGVLDEELVALAIAEARIVVSEDKDFGNLAFQRLPPSRESRPACDGAEAPEC